MAALSGRSHDLLADTGSRADSAPQPQAASCRHEKYAAGLAIISSSPPSPSSITTATHCYHQHPPLELELIQKPGQAYFSPHRIATSSSSPFTASTETIHECCAPLPAQAPRTPRKMGLSKTQRIVILLGIDSAFFLLELIVGKSW